MAHRNRKKKRVEGLAFPVPIAGLFIVVAMFGLAYVWLCCQCEALGRDLKTLENQKTELEKQFLNEEFKWTQKKAPRSMEAALARHGIHMAWPKRDQVVTIARTPVMEDQLARRDSGVLGGAGLRKTVMNE